MTDVKNVKDLKTKLKTTYFKWLEQELVIRDLSNGYIEITAPLLDSQNDYLQIYVSQMSDGSLILTDDSYTISNLQLSGVDLKTNKRMEIFNMMLNGFGVQFNQDTEELFIQTTIDDFPQKKTYVTSSNVISWRYVYVGFTNS